MSDLTRQQICAALQISESTVRRLELDGMPCTPVGRGKRYDLAECKLWLREYKPCQPGSTRKPAAVTLPSCSAADAFIASAQKMRRRVMPSSLKLISDSP